MPPSITTLLLAVLVFLTSHVGLSAARIRNPLVEHLGRGGFLIGYSIISLGAFAWLILAFNGADYIEIWPQSPWSRWVPVILMPFSCVSLTAGLATANATLTSEGEYPEKRKAVGILKVTRHPLLWAFLLWALAHLPANGDASALILFGMFISLAVAGMRRLDAKHARAYGAAWKEFTREAPAIPFAALIKGRTTLTLGEVGYFKVAAGVALYALGLYLHPWVIGVSAL